LFQFVTERQKEFTDVAIPCELRRVLEPLEGASENQLQQVSQALLTGKDDLGLQKAEQSVSSLLEAFKTAAATDTAALLKQPLQNLRISALVEASNRFLEYGTSRSILGRAIEWLSLYGLRRGITRIWLVSNPVNGQFTQFFNKNLVI
jgi:hypothetical protein